MADAWQAEIPPVRVSFRLDRHEFSRALRQTLLRDYSQRQIGISGALSLIAGVMVVARGAPVVGAVFLTLSGLAVLCVAYNFLALPGQSWKKVDSNRGEQVYEFSPEGVTYDIAAGHASVKWSTYTRVAETPHFYVFYIRSLIAHILPKHALTNGDDDRRLRELVQKYVPKPQRRSLLGFPF